MKAESTRAFIESAIIKKGQTKKFFMIFDPQNKKRYDSEDGILRFSVKEFIKVLIYHILYMMFLGPFACLIIGPIEGMAYLKSTKFFTCDYTLVTQIIPAASFVFAICVYLIPEE